MNTAANELLRTVSQIQDLQVSIRDITEAINKSVTTEESIRCFILRLVWDRDIKVNTEMNILSSPFCVVQLGVLRRSISRRETLERKLSELQEELVSKFQEHDYYQEQSLLNDIARLSLV